MKKTSIKTRGYLAQMAIRPKRLPLGCHKEKHGIVQRQYHRANGEIVKKSMLQFSHIRCRKKGMDDDAVIERK